MTETEKLYETLGELIYVVAKADGVIQESELESLSNLLKGHKFANEINWSFNYEASKDRSVEEVYAKVISVCDTIGPSPIYKEFIDMMNVIASADAHLDHKEEEVIHSFSKDLIERFKRDTDRYSKK